MSRCYKARSKQTFMDLLMNGEVLIEDVDDFVDAWHEDSEEDEAASLELPEFLGMTWDEYKLWVEQPEALKYIAAARKHNLSVYVLLQTQNMMGVAARSSDQSEACKLLDWLIATGRVKDTSR